jgi:5,10-methylenetetrahydromethanopterin reductase
VTAAALKLGIINPDPTDLPAGVRCAVDTLASAEQLGADSAWTSQEWGPDALTVLGLVAAKTRTIGLGTAIMPIWTRHPYALAQQALTLQQASGGRLALGVGPSHPQFIEPLGIPYRDVVGFTGEYLRVLTDLLRTGATDFSGTYFQVRAQIHVPAKPVRTLLSALGPRMLETAGRLAEGTVTFLASADYVRRVIRPLLDDAASRNARPRPTVIAAVQVALTSEPSDARQMIKEKLADYARRPAYRRLLAASGVAGPEDLALAGSLEHIAEGLHLMHEAGADEIIIEPVQAPRSVPGLAWFKDLVDRCSQQPTTEK